MNPAQLFRATLALLVLAVLVGGVVLGGGVTAWGEAASPTPSTSPTPGATPSSAPLPRVDVQGDDLERLPRYPGSVRTAYEVSVDERYRLTLTEYLADASIDDVRRFYQGVIRDHGWERADIAYRDGEWTYVLVDGGTEALIEIETRGGHVEIDLQISEPIPSPSPEPTPRPTAPPPPPAPVPQPDDDDDDGGGDGTDDSDDFDSDD